MLAVAEAGTHPGETELPTSLVDALWSPSFPGVDLVHQAADLLPGLRGAAGEHSEISEGPHWQISIGPGLISVRSKDYARAERTHERQQQATRATVDQLARSLISNGGFPDDPEPSRVITGWSRKSRSRMVERLCTLDYAPLFPAGRLPAMITLTYPGDWLTVAPSGKAAKRHLKAFTKRYDRAWNEPLTGVWKLEFQRRGAPHFHILMSPPHGYSAAGTAFREWLSTTWAQIVGHPDSDQYERHLRAGTGIDWNDGLRSTDPKRVAVYFTKHGAFKAKEYQHCVPEAWQSPGQGPGRFWGYWHLDVCLSTVEVTAQDAVKASRTLRRWSQAQGTTRQVTKMRVEQATGRIRYRNSRVRVSRLAHGRGFVSVNDGASFGSALARHLRESDSTRADQRAGLVAATGSGPGLIVHNGQSYTSPDTALYTQVSAR